MYNAHLYDKLRILGEDPEILRFCMPGHKGKKDPSLGFLGDISRYDYTELYDTDNLYQPEHIIKKMMESLKDSFAADISIPLAGGGSQGVKAMLYLASLRGKKMLFDRNIHRSVVEGMILCGIDPIYFEPETVKDFLITDGCSAKRIDEILSKDEEISAVFLTSATYFGVLSDIRAIKKICEKHNALLLCDDCHGSHLAFYEPKQNAQAKGSDFSVCSLHKTMGSLTGGAVLNYSGTLYEEKDLLFACALFGSSSPSYLILSSLDKTVDSFRKEGKEMLWKLLKQCEEFRRDFQESPVRLLDKTSLKNGEFDDGKIIINFSKSSLSAKEAYDILYYQEKIFCEGVIGDNLLILASVFNEEKDFRRLQTSLKKILENVKTKCSDKKETELFPIPPKAMEPRKAVYAAYEEVDIKNSIGRISQEMKYIYPPGVPFIVPGEIIDEEILRGLLNFEQKIKVIR